MHLEVSCYIVVKGFLIRTRNMHGYLRTAKHITKLYEKAKNKDKQKKNYDQWLMEDISHFFVLHHSPFQNPVQLIAILAI